MKTENTFLKFVKRILFLLALFMFYSSFGQTSNGASAQSPRDTIISDPISVDSLFVVPSMPREGDTIRLRVATTHSSSPCGLLDYKVLFTSSTLSNEIYVSARYWEGMLTAICHSTDKMVIGNLSPGKYVLNFMNKKKIEFTVHPIVNCHADFTYNYPKCIDSSKCINTVAFMDKSTGNYLTRRWNFGDSTFSSEINPVHSYKKSGVYNVCLLVAGSTSATCMDTKCKLVPVPASNCKAYFKYQVISDPLDSITASALAPFRSFIVKFTDYSAGEIIKWYWDFGDNTSSTEQNPVHRYREGVYTVTLKTATKQGCESKYSEKLILVDPQPICKYTGTVKDYSKLDGCKFIIELDNGIKLEPVSIIPNFVLRDSQRVILAYTPLKIATTCMVGIPAEITCIRDIVSPVCRAYFTYTKDSMAKCLNCAVFNFFDMSYGKAVKWHWNFGDGTASDLQSPTHTYFLSQSDSAFYSVCLSITTSDGCTSTYCEKIFVGKPTPSVPWVPVIGGDDNHSIVVPNNLLTNVSIEFGDYIGLFFRDYSGKLICGGMIRWEQKNNVLTAWADTRYYDYLINKDSISYPIPLWKNGFSKGEKFEYKIWKWRTNQEIYVQSAKYTINNMFPDGGFYKDDGLSLLASIAIGNKQTISLHSGWNLTSLNIQPESPKMKDIFGDLNVVVKNYNGEIVYFPQAGINGGEWNIYEGYKVKSLANVSLTASGPAIQPQTTIQLPGNVRPYFLPYYYTERYPIKSMMANINRNIRYVQTYEYINGTIKALNYIPMYNIDQIKMMKPGLAYKLSLFTAVRSFTYPPFNRDSMILCCPKSQSTIADALGITQEIGEDNRILVLPQEIINIKQKTEITAYTKDSILVGHEVAYGGSTAVTLWDKPDQTTYDDIVLKIKTNDTTWAYTINLTVNTTADGDLLVLNKGVISGIPNIVSAGFIQKVYPTLVTDEFYIDIQLENRANVDVSVYNMLGYKVKQIEFKNVSSGTGQLKVDVGNLANGQYIYQVKTDKLFSGGKIQVSK